MPGMRYQPQGMQRFDPSSRLRRGLISYLPLAGAYTRDVVDGAAWTVGVSSTPLTFSGSPRGQGARLKGINPAYLVRPNPTGSTSPTQPLTTRFRLFVNTPLTATAVALLSWATTSRDGAPCYYVRVSSSGISVYTNGGYHTGGQVVDQKEYIVTHVYDGMNHYEYLNGVQQFVTAGGSFSGSMTSMFFGTGYDGSTNPASDVTVSDLAIWNRALSPAEVMSDAQSPWQMFEAADTTLDDEPVVVVQAGYVDVVGAAVGSSNVSAVACAVMNAYGSSVALSTVAATANAVTPTSAVASGSGAASATAYSVWNVVGASQGSAMCSVPAFSVMQTVASASGTSSVQGGAVTVATANGTATGTASVTGNAACVWQVAANAAGVATVSAVGGFVSDPGQGQVTFYDTAGRSYGSSTVSAVGQTVSVTSGSSAGTCSVVASAQALQSAIGVALGSATVAATGAAVIATTGQAVGSSSVHGVCLSIYNTVANSLSVSTVQAVVQSVVATIANSKGVATVSGTTEGGVHYTASGDRFSVTITFSPYKITVEDKPYTITIN